MAHTTYAVRTATCTYLLDESGVCKWIEASTSAGPPAAAERCIGAQFVACLDLHAEGGLVGELCVGAAALFARHERDRFVLLRTLPIVSVDLRSEGAELPAYPLHADQEPPVVTNAPDEELDFEDLVSISVTEVTLILPLYRAPASPGRSPR